jgi:hypothetical protein
MKKPNKRYTCYGKCYCDYTHIVLSNHQHKILNKPHLNMVRFCIKLHTSQKISDGYRCDKCPMFTFLLFTTIFAMYNNIFV